MGLAIFTILVAFMGAIGSGDWLLTEKGGKANVRDNRSQVNIYGERDDLWFT